MAVKPPKKKHCPSCGWEGPSKHFTENTCNYCVRLTKANSESKGQEPPPKQKR